jgi:hypothetical protein
MEADHDQPSLGLQQLHRGAQPLLEVLEFSVDENPKSLKRARRRVLARLAGLDRTSHDFGQFDGASHRTPACAASNKRLCNRNSKPFFSIVTDHLGDLALIGALEKLRSGLAAAGVHAHVQRRIEAKTEAARRLVDLRRTDAQIEQHAVHAGDAARLQTLAHRGEAGVLDREARIVDALGPLQRRAHGLRVLVERHQPPAVRQPRQQHARMPATTERAVDVGAVRVADQRVDRFVQQDGDVRTCAGGHQKTKLLTASGIGLCFTADSCDA